MTIAFDAAYQGESGGEPRGVDNPFNRVDDISYVIDYLDTLPYVDSSKIGALGIMMEAPLLLIAGDKADTLSFSQTAYDADNGPKELYLVKGATHVDLYDKEPFVSETVIKLTGFFKQNLNGN